jgi:hypothetical protein
MVRILLLSSPFPFVNPTWELLVQQLVRDGVAIVFGPRTRRPCKSLVAVAKAFGPFDVVLAEPWFFFKSDSIPEQYCPIDIHEIDIPVIVSLMQYDLHNLSRKFLDVIKSHAACAISAASSHDFFYAPSELDFKNERWLNPASDSLVSDEALDPRFVLMPHCIAPYEFRNGNVRKTADLIIPGVGYYFRRVARERIADRAGISLATERDFLQKVLSRSAFWFPFGNKLWKINRPIGISLYQQRFRNAIARARVGVTCDASINYPIRKFFEIPALGTVLAAKFFDKPERLGFVPGENCYALQEDRLDDLVEIVRLAQSDSAKTKRIRNAGQEMVHELHSVAVRSMQLRDLCAGIASKRLRTIVWQGGKPVLQAVA